MSNQGLLAELLAQETERCLRLAGQLGDRLEGHLAAQRATMAKGVKLPPPDRDTMRVYREYRTTLEKMRLEAILRARLKLNLGEQAPMTEEEYRAEFEALQRELLQTASREDLERVLAERPVVRLPAPAGLAVIDAVGEERPTVDHAPPFEPVREVRGAPERGPVAPAGQLEQARDAIAEPAAAPAPRASEDPEPAGDAGDEEPDDGGGYYL